jgi:hypothetical protein
MIAVQEPKMRRGCPMGMKLLAALALALAAGGAFAQNGSAVKEPKVAPVRTQDMKPGYGVVESVTEVQLVPERRKESRERSEESRERSEESRERSAAAGGSAPGTPPGRPMYRVAVRMPDGSLQLRDLDKPEFKVGDNVLLTNAGDIVPD